MTSVAAAEVTVRYEGGSAQNELWGGTQANFIVVAGDEHQHEVAVLLPEAVATYLAGALGREDSPEFHAAVAREGGQCYLESLMKTGKHVAPFLMLSRAVLEADPALLSELKRRLSA